ncbi:CrcB family protein [Actinoplanes sp. NPDC051851]|uniref:fluoride efflux transporter FluC n=1 Tax=Actinoplanes sp. NPDC051851 TaxID=3154753 RepID=UPI0034220B03
MDLDVDRRAIAAVTAGGVIGALTRYAIAHAWPGSLWAIWLINVSGCFLIGVLYTRVHHRLPRLFLGTGVLGGYTTFSTAMVDVQHASPLSALVHLFGTVAAALVAVWAGSAIGSPR